MAGLSPYRLGKARDVYNLFNIFNSISWQFLVGTIILLLAMRLEASSTVLGLINAIGYTAFFFLPLGKLLSRKIPVVTIYGAAWVLRAIGMIPVIFIPLIAAIGNPALGVFILLIGIFIFHMSRGVGLVANNPVLNMMAQGPDRGPYLTQIQIVASAIGMFCSFSIAIVLGREPPMWLYSLVIAVGVGTGIFSGLMLLKLPEPEDLQVGSGDSAGHKKGFVSVFKEAFAMPAIRHFIIVLVLVAFVSGIARSFLTVYSREVFNQSDGMVSLYAVFGGLGNLMIGLAIKFLIDRIGVKPIYIVCTVLGLTGLIPVLFFPATALDNAVTVILFLSFIFFVVNFGFLGAEGIAQTYFLNLIPPAMMLDMSILYFLVFGFAGAGGNFLAGVFLDGFSALGINSFVSYKVLYAILMTIGIVILVLQRRLIALGSLTLRDAVGVMLSPRDLRAIGLLDKLNKTSDADKEEELLEQLHDSPSTLSIKGLLQRARSPRLEIRQDSLRALSALPKLDEAAVRALMDDIINNPYTTAYISARILGSHRCNEAIPLLRELTASDDYMLSGEAIIALARLKDDAFRPRIEGIISKTKNPRLKIMGVEAFGIFRSPHSLTTLLDILRMKDPPSYLRDETVLAMAAIVNVRDSFYTLLIRFLEDESSYPTLARDEAESSAEYFAETLGGWKRIERPGLQKKTPGLGQAVKHARSFQSAVEAYIGNPDAARTKVSAAAFARWILELPPEGFNGRECPCCSVFVQTIFSETVLDDELALINRLRLLIVHWAAWSLRAWSDFLKKSKTEKEGKAYEEKDSGH